MLEQSLKEVSQQKKQTNLLLIFPQKNVGVAFLSAWLLLFGVVFPRVSVLKNLISQVPKYYFRIHHLTQTAVVVLS